MSYCFAGNHLIARSKATWKDSKLFSLCFVLENSCQLVWRFSRVMKTEARTSAKKMTWPINTLQSPCFVTALLELEKERSIIGNRLTSKMIFVDDFACRFSFHDASHRPKTKHCNTNVKNLGPDMPTHFPSLLISISKYFEKWQSERKRRNWNAMKIPTSGKGRTKTNKRDVQSAAPGNVDRVMLKHGVHRAFTLSMSN